jgi:hypothetical protein
VDHTEWRSAFEKHIRGFFSGHQIEVRPIRTRRLRNLEIYAIGPGPRGAIWSYVTAGCWPSVARDLHGHGLEFILSANADDPHHIKLLTDLALFHTRKPKQRLDFSHSLQLTRPWTPQSLCEYVVIDFPVVYGEEFEHCHFADGHVRLLSAMPITATERAYKIAHGLDALGERFEEDDIDYANPERASIV